LIKEASPKLKPINATAERVATAPMFQRAYAKRRCLLQIDSFFGWKAITGAKAKQPYAIVMKAASRSRWPPFGRVGGTGVGRGGAHVLRHHHRRQRVGGRHPQPHPVIIAAGGLRRLVSTVEP